MADGHIHKHLQSMFHLLRNEETLKMAVKLESARYGRTRYLVVVSCSQKPAQRKSTQSQPQQQHFNNNLINAQNINNNKCSSNNRCGSNENQNNNISTTPSVQRKSEQSQQSISSPALIATSLKSGTKHRIIEKDPTNLNRLSTSPKQEHQQPQSLQQPHQPDQLNEMNPNNMNEVEESCLLGIDCNEKTTVGLVLRILGDTTIRLDGDGGFCISGSGRTHIFKPVSVQAMWSALQTLHKVCAKARENNLYPSGPSHEWVSYYDERIRSEQSCLNEWNAMDSLETRRPPSPDAIRTKPTEREETERVIRTTLKEIIVQLDLDEVTSKFIRTKLEEHLDMNLTEYKSYIDEEMLKILKQLDAPTKIFDHVYLGSEWNASNLEELQKNGVRHILNVTREIDNFFPGMFDYCNVRVYDDDKTNLLKHWDNTYKYISNAKNSGSNVLVHCKMGISRSASVVIAYAMKAYGWSFAEAIDHVKNNRNCIKPNKNFLNQLETYQGMLMAMKNKELLQRSKSDTNLRSVKDARLLPGSEPTPLIQAFNAAAKKQNENSFLSRCATLKNRPKSWSPDSVESAILLPKQHSQSLEHLPPECMEKVKLKNNMRLPCKNGQNYSVSQNQVFHLEESNVMQQCMSNVKLIVNELESNVKRLSEGKIVNKDINTTDTNLNATARVVTKPPISSLLSSSSTSTSSSSSACDRTSPFGSLKRSESNKSRSDYETSEKYSPVMKSRSLDVANCMITSTAMTAINAPTSTINTNKPPFGSPNNRHSLHEEAVTNTTPATAATVSISNPNVSPAWTRRFYNPTTNNNNNNINNNNSNNNNNLSSRSGSSSSNSSSSSNVSLSTDLINDLCKTGSKNVKNLRNAYSVKSINQNANSNKSVDILPAFGIDKRNLLNDSDSEASFVNMTIARLADQFSKDIMQRIKKRCKSDGMLYESELLATVNKRFSSSSPSDYTEKAFNNRPAITWNNRLNTTNNNNKHNIQIKGKRHGKNRSTLCQTVENLKLNFESKPNDASNIGIAKEAKRGKSLPSSPVASVYSNNMPMVTNPINESTTPATPATLKLNYDKLGCEEINVKGLVDKYEVTKTTTTAATTSTPLISRFKRHTIHQSPHNTIHPKPPPIPHASIVVASKPANILLSKPLHQNNQSFARLKEHFNSTSAYNTM
ncbi:protein phosphatase Slingshot homolog 2 [Contarinia nasturtii]|uniref:protein phosphatase Slingshot homolog 2 n=1 Tax=Contarinia nasturtii TaxID=265458 RepID=UPI0012D3FDC1|nr:protein phosphatase Slingshot homolog 2 [Contarinia nasturtii]XP_031627864.1 protein phosphatase Slingshot homolog 2 [Contarinia nasturtii]XP_031627865.1 protein phosphatase Slingshot homolog 2 [Contarinia nasturtii]XP_031627866.1 protein phosphatase Slingshot homolog 2 [Contarinia nasturtii]